MKRALLVGVAAAVLMAGQALGADLPVKAPVLKAPPMAPAYSWSGCYIGAHIGGGWGDKSWTNFFQDTEESPVTTIDFGKHKVDGMIGGGQIGCNVQNGPVVFGLEGDASWSGIDGSFDAFPGDTIETKVKWLGTVTGRLGYAVDRLLFYVKGGVAFTNDEYTEVDGGTVYKFEQNRWGYTVGAGVEFALTGQWTAKLEYNFMDFGNKSVDVDRGSFPINFRYDIDQQIHVVKFGINYRFGSDVVVVAKH